MGMTPGGWLHTVVVAATAAVARDAHGAGVPRGDLCATGFRATRDVAVVGGGPRGWDVLVVTVGWPVVTGGADDDVVAAAVVGVGVPDPPDPAMDGGSGVDAAAAAFLRAMMVATHSAASGRRTALSFAYVPMKEARRSLPLA